MAAEQAITIGDQHDYMSRRADDAKRTAARCREEGGTQFIGAYEFEANMFASIAKSLLFLINHQSEIVSIMQAKRAAKEKAIGRKRGAQ